MNTCAHFAGLQLRDSLWEVRSISGSGSAGCFLPQSRPWLSPSSSSGRQGRGGRCCRAGTQRCLDERTGAGDEGRLGWMRRLLGAPRTSAHPDYLPSLLTHSSERGGSFCRGDPCPVLCLQGLPCRRSPVGPVLNSEASSEGLRDEGSFPSSAQSIGSLIFFLFYLLYFLSFCLF